VRVECLVSLCLGRYMGGAWLSVGGAVAQSGCTHVIFQMHVLCQHVRRGAPVENPVFKSVGRLGVPLQSRYFACKRVLSMHHELSAAYHTRIYQWPARYVYTKPGSLSPG
jgi:hypothetical protein